MMLLPHAFLLVIKAPGSERVEHSVWLCQEGAG